jgi:hypothetical protein
MAPLVFGIANCFDQKPGKKNNKFLFALSRTTGVSSARRYQARKKFLSLLTTQNISTEEPLEKINKLPLLGPIARLGRQMRCRMTVVSETAAAASLIVR